MCRDGNSASRSARYLNGQLATLWDSAVECIEECGDLDLQSTNLEADALTRALAEYKYRGREPSRSAAIPDEPLFDVRFGRPQLRFICNHEAVLHLSIERGRLNLDFHQPVGEDNQSDPSRMKSISNVNIVARFQFTRSSLKARDANNRALKHRNVSLVTLALSDAKLAALGPEIGLGGDEEAALLFYMSAYLKFLQSANLHILYDIPDFDGTSETKMDHAVYSSPSDAKILGSDFLLHGVDVYDINAYLQRKWLSAASVVELPEDPLSVCLAALDSSWLPPSASDTRLQFRARFGPPTVTALCPSEAVLRIHVEDIDFCEPRDTTREKSLVHYRDWTVAYALSLVQDPEHGMTRLRLDLPMARFSDSHSQYDRTLSTAVLDFKRLERWILTEYFGLLTQYDLDIAHVPEEDTRDEDDRRSISSVSSVNTRDGALKISLTSNGAGSNGEAHHKEKSAPAYATRWIEQETDMSSAGFDQIMTISEHTINATYTSLWQGASRYHLDAGLLHGPFETDEFQATFRALKCCLLSNGNAVVWVDIDEGKSRVLREVHANVWTPRKGAVSVEERTVESFHFDDITVAFEVRIVMAEESKMALDAQWQTRFEMSSTYSASSSNARTFHHVFFDFYNAKYVPELSVFNDLGEGHLAVGRSRTIISRAEKYLGSLAAGGYHIVHSVPTFLQEASSPAVLTSVGCQVVSKHDINTRNCMYKRKPMDSPAIVVLGACGNRSLPRARLDSDSPWFIRGRSQGMSGTICLSRERFLEGRILHALSGINTSTTLVPNYIGVIEGEWQCDLSTWNKNEYRKNTECRWKRQSDQQSGYIAYEWQHREDRTRKHEGSDEGGHTSGGEYRLTCLTKNVLRIPATFRNHRMDIELSGESTVFISAKTDRVWSAKSCATWSTSILIRSESSAIAVDCLQDAKPTFADVKMDGDPENLGDLQVPDVAGIHAKSLPDHIDVASVILGLRTLCEKPWDGGSVGDISYLWSNPLVNKHGDVLIGLHPLTPEQLGVTGNGLGTPRRWPRDMPSKLSLRHLTSASALVREVGRPLSSSRASSRTSFNSTPPARSYTPPATSTGSQQTYVRQPSMRVPSASRVKLLDIQDPEEYSEPGF